MSNLLRPVGVPQKAYCREKEVACEGRPFLSCEVISQVKKSPIYEATGPMPDHPQAWIRSDRGTKRLQHEELTKAKGVPSSWLKGEGAHPLHQSQVNRATCVHLWTAAMDVMWPWLSMDNEREDTKASNPKAKEEVLKWDTNDEDEGDWQWETPDLSEGGKWFLARVYTV